MKGLKQFLVDFIMDVMNKNEGKRVILKNGRTLTCISENRTQRYAVGKGKEGKFIAIKSLYDYLRTKKIESYCILENDSKISLYTDDVKTLNFIKMPTEKDYDKYVEDEEKSRQEQYIKTDMELWTRRLNDRINDGELITGYTLNDSTCGRYKDIILDLVTNEGEATLHMGTKSEEHLQMILGLVKPLITKKPETNDGENDSEIFYIKTTDGYEEVKGFRVDNKYGLEIFCHKTILGNYRLSHTPTGIAINDTITCHKDELLNKIDDLVAKNGLDKVKKAFNNVIEKYGYVPNYCENDSKNDYLNTMVEYAKTLEVKYYQKLRRHSMYDDIFEYASKNKLSNNDIELMLYMRQEFDKEEGLPNFPCEFTNNDIDEGKNEGEIVMDKDISIYDKASEDVLKDIKEQLYKGYNTQKIGLSIGKHSQNTSYYMYVAEMMDKREIKEIKVMFSRTSNIEEYAVFFISDDRKYIVLKSIDEVIRLIVREFDLSPVCTDDNKNEGGNSTYEYLIPDTNSRIINGRFEESINTREDGSKWTCFSGHYKSAKKEIFFTATDRENEGEFKIFTNRNQFNNDLLLTDMEHGVYIMHKEWNNKRCTDDDKKDIVGVKVFLEEVKTFSKDTKSTLQGQVHCRQRCYYRLEKYSSDVFVIECKLYTNDDNLYTSRISDMNDDNNISIFKYRGVFEEGFKQLLEFFNRYHKVYNLFIGSNDGKKDISELMSSLMSKLEHSGELRCFMDSSTLTGIIQQCAEKKTYIKYSKNDDCFYIDCQSNIVSLPLVQLINNKLKIYDIEFEIVKADNRRCIRIQLDEGNLSIL